MIWGACIREGSPGVLERPSPTERHFARLVSDDKTLQAFGAAGVAPGGMNVFFVRRLPGE